MPSEPYLYTYPSPLSGYENLEPLSEEKAADGKSYINPPAAQKSSAYASFTHPITNGARGGFDIHVYYVHTDAVQMKYAKELRERIRREFPELRMYKLWEAAIGPHPVAMFEVNVFTPGPCYPPSSTSELAGQRVECWYLWLEQFGAFIPWLLIWRGPLSCLVHPNTNDEIRDHTQRAIWMGQPYPLIMHSMPGFAQVRDGYGKLREESLDEKEKQLASRI
jgi:aromatic ring-cleaving dioxygenase